jgi:hypothetical protein
MAAIGGDVAEITYNHPTLGTGNFQPIAGEDNTFQPGGLVNNDDAASITADGQIVVDKSRIRGSFEVVVVNDMNTREDLTRAKSLVADTAPAQWTISLINGTVWAGVGVIVGELDGSIKQSRFTLKIAAGEWRKIA